MENVSDENLMNRFDERPDMGPYLKKFRDILQKLHGLCALFIDRIYEKSAPVKSVAVAALLIAEKYVFCPVIKRIGDKRKNILGKNNIPPPVISPVLADVSD